MNYAELKVALVSFLEGDGISAFTPADLDTFISQAEQKIYNTVQLPALRKNVVGNVSVGNEYLTVPTDFLSVFSLSIVLPNGEQSFLLNKDVSYIRSAYPSRTAQGIPKHYALFDDNTLIMGPTPNVSYNSELHYFFYPESIVTANNTWLGDNFDSALLYGALREGYIHMKGEELFLKTYAAQYGEAMGLLKQLGDGRNRQDMYRTPQVRYPVK